MAETISKAKSKLISNAFVQIAAFFIVLMTSLYGGMIWNGVYGVQIVLYVSLLIVVIFTYFSRRRDRYAKLPKLEIEWAISISLLVIISSWVLSPLPRQGIWRMGTIIGYFALLYFLIDMFASGFNKQIILNTIFIVVGIYLFSAVLEIFLAYQSWFVSISSYKILPPTIYRFSSLLGHSNALMAAANLLAPIGVINLLQQKKIFTKISMMMWLLLYGICILFSSSRGGYVGFLSWVAVLLGYFLFLYQSDFIRKYRKTIIIIVTTLGIVAAILIIVFGGYLVTHPSHGSSLFSTREVMWSDAVKIWQEHPWFGAGPGRVPFEILDVNSTIPPGYFPNHVHSTWLQILAEFGLMGLLTFLLINFQGIKMLVQQWLHLPTDNKLMGTAYMASFAGFFFHSFLDDFSGWIFVISILIGLVAIFLTMIPDRLQVWREINVRAIFIPIGILLFAAGYSIWSQAPYREGVKLYQEGQFLSAAEKMTDGIKRDRNSSYLYTQSGLAWAKVWAETDSAEALANAREYFRGSISIEGTPSYLWADLAVLDWYAGDHVIAMEHIRRAISISDKESSHYLIYGYFLELMNHNEDASEAYQKVIDLWPASCSHPFWQQTRLRQNFACDITESYARSGNSLINVQEAAEAIEQTEYHQAIVALQRARWVGENNIAIDTMAAKLSQALGDEVDSKQLSEKILANDLLFNNYIKYDMYHLVFSRWLYRTKGLDFILVPGYLQINPDYGQFEIAEQYLCQANEDLNRKVELQSILSLAINAGAIR